MAIHDALVVRYDSGEGLTHGTESYVGNASELGMYKSLV